MTLEELKEAAPDLATMGHPEKIRLFGWWLHVHKGRAHFQAADIGKCYDDLTKRRQDNWKIWGERLQGRQSIGSSIHAKIARSRFLRGRLEQADELIQDVQVILEHSCLGLMHHLLHQRNHRLQLCL